MGIPVVPDSRGSNGSSEEEGGQPAFGNAAAEELNAFSRHVVNGRRRDMPCPDQVALVMAFRKARMNEPACRTHRREDALAGVRRFSGRLVNP